ncbi:MAG: GNAT family N-acetyltransferase [Pseudomonadota bacterium]|nr:GNAT family N-acetyltransferase [Gammaproteobacteria bacterium]MBU1926187.1 GNAT family N-acetyltransferase [Gammaproteobacteria bacterium]MBU2545545.1 GNAT family N-acetyltransferase [Gammaproteobacteria bacterium]
MKEPSIETERLLLRMPQRIDIQEVVEKINDKEIAENTSTIPYPYDASDAEIWLEKSKKLYEAGEGVNFVITLKNSGEIVGGTGLKIEKEHQHAELGYWIAKAYRGQGICTEAAKGLIQYGFKELKLHRIIAQHFSRNPGSGRVMLKIGMRHEGSFREHFLKNGQFEDAEFYSILASDL